MNKKQLDELKKVYLSIHPQERVDESWKVLSPLLPEQERPTTRRSYRYTYFFTGMLAVVLVVSLSVAGIAQAAQPGDALYPVKVLSDKVVSTVLGKPQIQVQRRANDVINSSNKAPENLEKATNEYQKALNDAKQEANEQDTKKTELKNTLQQQTEKLKEVHTDNPKAQGLINQAVNATEQTQQEVKGASTNVQTDHSHQPDHPTPANENSSNGKNK